MIINLFVIQNHMLSEISNRLELIYYKKYNSFSLCEFAKEREEEENICEFISGQSHRNLCLKRRNYMINTFAYLTAEL